MSDNQYKEKGERLKKLREFLGFPGRKMSSFSSEIGYAQSNLSNIEAGIKDLPVTVAKALSDRYNVNANWLLFGKGEMIENSQMKISNLLEADKTNVSFYDIDVFAGYSSGGEQQENIIEKWQIPDLVGEHIAVTVKGNSMEGTLSQGDRVVAKEIKDNSEICHDSIYIIVYEGAPIIKRLCISKGAIELRSDNPFYKTIYADLDQISALFRVVLSIRTMG